MREKDARLIDELIPDEQLQKTAANLESKRLNAQRQAEKLEDFAARVGDVAENMDTAAEINDEDEEAYGYALRDIQSAVSRLEEAVSKLEELGA